MENKKQIIYLDNNATTPTDKRVLEAMLPFFMDEFANASSAHSFGLKISESVKSAREKVAQLINAEPHEIVFTSGATEAINQAIKGVAENYQAKGNHIVTAATEHLAVLDTCQYLETQGYEVTYLLVGSDGLIDLADLKSALRVDTILVSIMLANNETGVLQPIKEIADLTHGVGAIFMTDATQAVGKIPVNVDELGVDLLCMSGHKLYAPKGIGALFLRQTEKRIKIPSLLHGGGHEGGMRSGTLNVPGIIGFGTACEIAFKEMAGDAERIGVLRDELEKELLKIPGAYVNGSTKNRMFNVSNICFPGIDANVMIGQMKNVAVSNGSACSSSVIQPSHVLKAMGLSDDDAFASIRFSLGRFNEYRDIIIVVEILNKLIQPGVAYA